MLIVTSKEMFTKAYRGGYAVGAFNIFNMETIQGVTEAAKELNAPLILQVSSGSRRYMNHTYLRALVEAAVMDTELPVCLHLDHGYTFERCKDCIDSGFTSVMFDGSRYSFNENITITKQVCDYAHENGAVVEGSLGSLGGIGNKYTSKEDDILSEMDKVEAFVIRTGVDSLAVDIETRQGDFRGESKFRFEILEEIQKRMPEFPLALHEVPSANSNYVNMINQNGGKIAGVPSVTDDMLRKAASMSICKINIDADLRLAMTAALRKYFSENPSGFEPQKFLAYARVLIKQTTKNKLTRVLGCTGKA